MKFSYTALTSDNKKISGVFDVENKPAAEAELHKMGVAIISLDEISAEKYEQLKVEGEKDRIERGIQTFSFVGVDPNKKEAEGTIDATNAYSAYRRLSTEYNFTVRQLYPVGSAPEQQAQANTQLVQFKTQLEQEMASEVPEGEAGEEKQRVAESERITAELTKEVDKVIISTKKALETHGGLFSNELKQEVLNTLSELERVRTSNNIKHITEVANDLYTLISNPDKLEGQQTSEEYRAILGDVQESALVKKEFDLYKKALEATKVKRLFGSVADRLKNLTAPKEGEVRKAGLKLKFHKLFKKMAAKKPIKVKAVKPKGKFGLFFSSLSDFFSAKSPVMKKARKKELMTRFSALFKKGGASQAITPESGKAEEAAEPTKAQEVAKAPEAPSPPAAAKAEAAPAEKEPLVEPAKPKKEREKRNFTAFLTELDSFTAWLLSFYIIYFFLVNFSLEKNIGLPRDFVFKTLKTPLILNISILLLIIHLTLRTRNLHFRHGIIGSLFLFLFAAGVYTLLVTNF